MPAKNSQDSAGQNEPTFEEMMAQLDAIVESVEEGKIGLEELIDAHEKGMRLYQKCRKMLTDAESRIQKLQAEEGGQARLEPFQEE